MISHWRFDKKLCPFKFTVLLLTLGLGGCATVLQDAGSGYNADNSVPEYVRNLPKSATGNMAQYTVFGKRYKVMDSAANFTEQGKASWYGDKFHGRKTSSGEIYDMYAMTAAHKHLPLPTFVRVTNLENGKSVVVKVNDRGPFVGRRIIDLSLAAAEALDMVEQGTAEVRVEGLSTHLVEDNPGVENLSESNRAVAQVIDAGGKSSAAGAPEVVEPELAAVPLPIAAEMLEGTASGAGAQVAANTATKVLPVAAVETDSVPIAANAPATVEQFSDEVVVDSSEDGFVELTDVTVGPDNDTDAAANVFIQLGAFSHAPNAQALVENVADQVGLPAYVEQDATRTMFRVKMGPFQQGELLDNTLSELAGVGIEGYTLKAVTR